MFEWFGFMPNFCLIVWKGVSVISVGSKRASLFSKRNNSPFDLLKFFGVISSNEVSNMIFCIVSSKAILGINFEIFFISDGEVVVSQIVCCVVCIQIERFFNKASCFLNGIWVRFCIIVTERLVYLNFRKSSVINSCTCR